MRHHFNRYSLNLGFSEEVTGLHVIRTPMSEFAKLELCNTAKLLHMKLLVSSVNKWKSMEISHAETPSVTAPFFFFFLLNSVIPNFKGISKSSVFRRNPLSCLSLAQKMNPSLVTVNAGLSVMTMNLTSTNQVGCSTKEICLGLFGVHKSNPDLKRWSISDLLKNILNQFDAD